MQTQTIEELRHTRELGLPAGTGRGPARLGTFCRLRLLAVMAQSLEIDDGHAAIFEPQQAFLLQPLQAPVRILPGDAGQGADFLLRDLQMKRQGRIENGIEQRSDTAREARRSIQRAAIFKQRDELPKTFVELPDQETIEAHAVLEQPE